MEILGERWLIFANLTSYAALFCIKKKINMELQEHLEKKLKEWRDLFEEAKRLKAPLHTIYKYKASFFAYKEMLDFMKNNAGIAVVRLSFCDSCGEEASHEVNQYNYCSDCFEKMENEA